ncbi:hypothetical protein FACS189485_11100 [Spirochaetia bacterium]|nr:hypothetical protein FACS189485_11100 [Spirochaetia bacterium]
MMKIFILEDDHDRIDYFIHNFSPFAELTVSESYRDAIKKFNPPYNAILLDHDLGGLIYVDVQQENTGSQFCKWLCKKNGVAKDTPMVIHSHNDVGAEHMNNILTSGGFTKVNTLPFDFLAQHWERGTLNFLGHVISEEK